MILVLVALIRSISNVTVRLSNVNVQEIVMDLLDRYDDLIIHNTYGEIAIMLNPNNQLAKGKYFSTIKAMMDQMINLLILTDTLKHFV